MPTTIDRKFLTKGRTHSHNGTDSRSKTWLEYGILTGVGVCYRSAE
jgi:hypothetical protein